MCQVLSESSMGSTHVKDRRQTTARGQGFNHDRVHFLRVSHERLNRSPHGKTYIVNDVTPDFEVNGVDGFVVTVSLVAVSIFRLTSVSGVCASVDQIKLALHIFETYGTHNGRTANRSVSRHGRASA